jgi:hypothetical protein
VQEEKIKEAAAVTKTETIAAAPVVKQEEIKTVAKNQQVNAPEVKEKQVKANDTKPAENVKTETASAQPIIKQEEAKAVVKEQPVKQATVKTQETAVAKNNPPAIQKPATVKVDSIANPAPTVITKNTNPEPAKIKSAVNAALDIVNRTIETIQSVNYSSDSLVLTLYDNGEVDGDTVSVLMNGEVIMPRVGLTTNAVRKTIYTKDLPDSIQIVMYAETLGSLPPNTGLLIVYDGRDRYEIRFSGDLKKNAAIVFRRKEN